MTDLLGRNQNVSLLNREAFLEHLQLFENNVQCHQYKYGRKPVGSIILVWISLVAGHKEKG